MITEQIEAYEAIVDLFRRDDPITTEHSIVIGALEALIDRFDVATVTSLLADICDEKAEHLLSTWQDKTIAAQWTAKARKLNRTALELDIWGCR
jgi:hypothetical protein